MSNDAERKDSETVEELRARLAALEAEVATQKRLLDATAGREAQYRTLFELMPGSVVLLDVKGFVRDANPYFCRGMGYARKDLLGLHVSKISNEKSELIEENIRRMLNGEKLEHEVVNVQKDGSLRFYEVREAAVTLPDGSQNILAVSNDITDRKRAEQAKLEIERQLLHTQKLESLGILAGGIAHDFNNLLAIIMCNVDLATADLPASSPARTWLSHALRASQRAAGLTRQMLAYSGRGHFVIANVDLSKLVQEMVELLKVSISKSAGLELNLADGLPAIQADTVQVQQVIMNLITNASEAIGQQPGTIKITTRVRDCDSAFLGVSRVVVKPPPGRYVVLEVADTGCGMDANTQEKLFDPFFTTKFVGRGLGMSAVLGIVKGHRAAILVSSQPGHGTTIEVLFGVVSAPLSRPQPGDTELVKSTVGASAISGTVLIAEDEPQLRSALERSLKRMGLNVWSAEDGEQALALFQEHAAEITFLLLDLTMPKLDGLRTLAEIHKLRPGIRAVLMSGYDSGELMRFCANKGFDAFIQKPWNQEILKGIVQRMCAMGP